VVRFGIGNGLGCDSILGEKFGLVAQRTRLFRPLFLISTHVVA
jgi:hypothetical protein